MFEQKNQFSKYIFAAIFLLITYLSYLLVKPLLGAIVAGLIMGYICLPLHKRLLSYIKSPSFSAFIITLSIIVIAVVLLSLMLNMLVSETLVLYEKFSLKSITEIFAKYIPSDTVENYLTEFSSKGVSYLLSLATSLVFGAPKILLALFIAIIVFFFTLHDSALLKEKIIAVMPVEQRYKEKIINKFVQTVDAVVYSTLLLSIIEGIVATIGFYIFGVKTALIWGLVTIVVSMLPFIGPAIVWVPMVVYLFFIGEKTSAIGLGFYCLILLSIFAENVVKPHLIARKGRMHPVVALLGVIGGVSVFGVSGIILGPFVLSLFLFVLEVLTSQINIRW